MPNLMKSSIISAPRGNSFKVRFHWELWGQSGFSSYAVVAKDSDDALQRARNAAHKDFRAYTLTGFYIDDTYAG